MRLAPAIVLIALLCPDEALAQDDLGRRLEDPRAGERTALSIVSDVQSDRVTVGDHSCATPCQLRLLPGTYAVEYRSGPSKTLVLGEHRTLLSGRPSDSEEQIVGILLIVAAAGVFATLAATGDIICWDFTGDVCSPDLGPALLGLGVMSFAIGVALVFDADAQVRVSVLGGPR